MKKDEFRKYLEDQIGKKPASDCVSRCNTVETALGVDLDKEFKRDRGERVLSILRYTKRDANDGVPAPKQFVFRDGCNVVQRLTDLRSATNRYFRFLDEL